jgi:OmcA/MtrC family decaheme c-type cytochrome
LFEHIGGTGAEIPSGGHVHLYADQSNAALAFGTAAATDASSYVSAANVEGCQKCHGTPYLKHGFRAAKVGGIPDFAACKSCHYDDRNGGHGDWQYMVDEPFEWATGVLTGTDIRDAYPYTANVMNDTHMSHAMEFPYPQSMQNCATCHEGKLDRVISDTTFAPETCLSCHPLNGTGAWPKTVDANGDEVLDDRGRSIPEKYLQGNRAPAMAYLWWEAGVESFHPTTQALALASPCGDCHQVGGAATQNGKGLFSDYHTGYDVNITDENGVRYTDAYTVAIDAVSYDSVTGLITVEFSASDAAIVPELYISFYGWDSKNFIAAGHERDGNDFCQGFRPGCQMEYTPESSGGSASPIFTEDAASVPGDWKVVADPSQWQLTKTDDIPTMIADGIIRRIEVMLAPELNLADLATPGPDLDVVLEGVSQTFDLNLGVPLDDFFKGENAVVSTEKCNVCHDVLASSFHSESGRGGDGIVICKNCHNVTYAGSHLEMASRSIDSYVHAIHSFQDFDPGDTFETFDPVDAKRYDLHTKHVFPNFTIRNCQACHLDPATEGNGNAVYNVPSQAESMPSLLSSSDTIATWYDIVDDPNDPLDGLAVENPAGRKIGSVPQYVVGAASRACGGCHRARLIRDDAAGELAAWNAHTEAFGTLVENSEPDDAVLYGVIDKIMSLFE